MEPVPGGRGVGPAPVEDLEAGLFKDVAGQEDEGPCQDSQECHRDYEDEAPGAAKLHRP